MWNLSKRHLSIWKTEHIFPFWMMALKFLCFFQIDRRLVPDFHFCRTISVLKPGYALEIGLLVLAGADAQE